MQQHAESWRFGHRRQPAVGTGEQASHEQVWSVTLALATIKGMVDRPNDRYIQVCEELDAPVPTLMLCSSTHKLVALVACGCGLDLGCVGGGL